MKFITVNGILIFFIILRATSNNDSDDSSGNNSTATTPLAYSERGTTQLCELDYLFIRSLIATLEQIQIVTNATSKTWATLFTTHAFTKPKSNKTTLRSNKRLTKAFRTKIYDRFDMHRKRKRRNVDFSDLNSIEREAIGINISDKHEPAFPGDSHVDGLAEETKFANDEVNKDSFELEKGVTWKPMWGTGTPAGVSKLDKVPEKFDNRDGYLPPEMPFTQPQILQQSPTTQSNMNEEQSYEHGKGEEPMKENLSNLAEDAQFKQTKTPCNETENQFKAWKKVWIKQPCGKWKDMWTDIPLPLAPEHAKWFIKQHDEPDEKLKPAHMDNSSVAPLKAVQTWFKKEYIEDPSKVTECPGYGWTKIWKKQSDGKWKTDWKQLMPTQEKQGFEEKNPSWTRVWVKQPDGQWKTGWKKVVPTQPIEKKSWNKQSFSANNGPPDDGSPRWTKVWMKQPDGKWKTGWKQVVPTQSIDQPRWNKPGFSGNDEKKPDDGGSPRWTKVWMKQPDGKWKTGWKQVVPTQSFDQPRWNKPPFSGNDEKKLDDGESPRWTKVWMKQPDGKWKTGWKKVVPTQSIDQPRWNKPGFSGNDEKKPDDGGSPRWTKVWMKQPDGKWKTAWKQVAPSQTATKQMPVGDDPQWTKVWVKQPDGKWRTEMKQVIPRQHVTKQMPDEGPSPRWTKIWIKQPDGKWKTGWKQVTTPQSADKPSWNKQQFSGNNEIKPEDGPKSNSHSFWTQYPDGKWGTIWKQPEFVPEIKSNQPNPIQDLLRRFSLPIPGTSDGEKPPSSHEDGPPESHEEEPPTFHNDGDDDKGPPRPPHSHEQPPKPHSSKEIEPPISQEIEPPMSHEIEPPMSHEIEPPVSHEEGPPLSHEDGPPLSNEDISSPH